MLTVTKSAEILLLLAAQGATDDDGFLSRLADSFKTYYDASGMNPLIFVAVFALLILAILGYRFLRPVLHARQEIETLFRTLVAANGLSADEAQELRTGVAAIGLQNPIVIFTRRSLLEQHLEALSGTIPEPERAHRAERLRQIIDRLYA